MKHLKFMKMFFTPLLATVSAALGGQRHMTRRKLSFLAAALVSLAFALPLPAPSCSGGCTSFGVFDVTAGDTLRLNFIMPPHASAGACILQAAIIQPTTGPCFECTLAGPSTITLSPGQSGALEYVGGFPVRALPQFTPSGRPELCDQVTASVEVYDTVSRRTRLLDSGIRPAPPDLEIPAGPPQYPSAGLTSADTMRINVFLPAGPPIIPSGPPSAACTAHAMITSPSDVLSQTTAILRPGQSASLDYSDATIATRRQVRPAVSIDGPPAFCGNVITTAELLDTASGRTFVLFPGGPIAPPAARIRPDATDCAGGCSTDR